MPADELCPDNFRDIKEALIVQNSFNIVPTYWMFGPSFPSLFIFVLQFLQPQSHATNNGYMMTFIWEFIL